MTCYKGLSGLFSWWYINQEHRVVMPCRLWGLVSVIAAGRCQKAPHGWFCFELQLRLLFTRLLELAHLTRREGGALTGLPCWYYRRGRRVACRAVWMRKGLKTSETLDHLLGE